MEIDPETAAVKASSKYGTRGKVAFASLGTRPMDVLLEEGEPVSVSQMVDALEEDDDAGTVQRWSVKKYFEILEDYGIVEHEDDGDLFRAWDDSVRKNGTSYEEFKTFVDRYDDL